MKDKAASLPQTVKIFRMGIRYFLHNTLPAQYKEKATISVNFKLDIQQYVSGIT